MPFNRELEDFAGSFAKGYSMIRSPEEREADRTRNEFNKGLLEQQQYEKTRRPFEERKEDIGLRSSEIDLSAREYENSEKRRAVKEAAEEAALAHTEAETARLRAAADPENWELDQEAKRLDNESKRIANKAAKFEQSLDDVFMKGWESITDAPGSAPLGTAVPTETEPTGNEDVMEPVAVPTEDDKGDTGRAVPYTSNDQPTGSEGLAGTRLNRAQTAIEDWRRGIDPNIRDLPDPSAEGISPEDKAATETIITHDAAKQGMKYLAELSGLNQESAVDTPEIEQQQTDFLTNVNAASPETVEMVKDTVQEREGRQMSENEKNRKGLAYGYKFYMDHGRPDKATRFAAGMMGHFQMMAGRYGSFAQAAADAGDPDAAAEAIMRAYDYIPSGNILKITKKGDDFVAEIQPEGGGKPISQQIMSPEELMSAAMNITPSSFIPLMQQSLGIERKTVSEAFAKDFPQYKDYTTGEVERAESIKRREAGGGRYSTKAGGKAEPTGTETPGIDPKERPQVEADLESALDKFETDAVEMGIENVYGDKDERTEQVVPGKAPGYYRDEVKRGAFEIIARNTDIMYSDAVEASRRMVETRPQRVENLKNNQVRIQFDELPPMVMNKEVYRSMSNLRNLITNPEGLTQGELSPQEADARQEAVESGNADAKKAKAVSDAQRRRDVRRERGWPEPERRDPTHYPRGTPRSLLPGGPQRVPESRANPDAVLSPRYTPPSEAVPVGPQPSASSIPGEAELQAEIDNILFARTSRAPRPREPIPASTPSATVPMEQAVPTGGGMSISINPNPAPRAPFIRPNPEDYPFPLNPY